MASQIVRNLSAHGGFDAIEQTALHLTEYWDPRMVAQLRAIHLKRLPLAIRRVVEALDRRERERSATAANPPEPIKRKTEPRSLRHNACSEVRVFDIETQRCEAFFTSNSLLEAPNWHPRRAAIYVNGDGKIFEICLMRKNIKELCVYGIGNVNNDHIISPDGKTLFMSSDGDVFSVSVSGGIARRITHNPQIEYYLHGVSGDGQFILCTGIRIGQSPTEWSVREVHVFDGTDRILLASKVPLDAPEYSPDGKWVWFNSEIGATIDGHARLFRILRDGCELERMTDANSVDWFPHFSPNGRKVVFLSYPPGTRGHPPDLPVVIKIMDSEGGQAKPLAHFTGGQGTINVNSWSPDGRSFAYVAYPTV